MPGISSAGVGSGLDVRGLVDKLVAAEGDPVKSRLDRKETNIQQGLTAIGSFKGALLDFQSSLTPLRKADAFKSLNATSSNEDAFSVVADDSASSGSYAVEIEQLAQSQKLKSRSFDSEFEALGSGTLTIEFGAENSSTGAFDSNISVPPQHIKIDKENNSLRGIQQAINDKKAGVHASIINDGSGYLLILNSDKTGREYSLRVSVKDDDGNDTDSNGLSSLAYNPAATATSVKNLEQTAEAKDAIFSVDGITISNSQNEIKNSVPGVTFTLKKPTEGKAESFTIEKDVAGVKKSIQGFVSSYNDLMKTVNALTGVDSETGKAGPLSGDASVRGIVEQIRRRLSTSFNGINENLNSLSTIGIDSSRDGSLTLNEFKLDNALRDHADEIAHLFAAAVTTTDPKIRVLSKKTPSVNGAYKISISQTPSKGILSGHISSGFPLLVNEQAGALNLSVDNILSSKITLPSQTYATGSELATALQAAINSDTNFLKNNVAVTVQYSQNGFDIISNSLGSNSKVAINNITQSLSELTGLAAEKGKPGKGLVGSVDGYEVQGEGNKLKLQGPLSGIELDVKGSQTGERGELVVTNGIAAILDDLSNTFLADKGVLDSRIDGYNARIKDIAKQREALSRKLEVSHERYLKQFSNLDAMLGKMRSTSNFLAKKLSPPDNGK